MEKTTLWVTKDLRNKLMTMKFKYDCGTIEKLLEEMIVCHNIVFDKKTKEEADNGRT